MAALLRAEPDAPSLLRAISSLSHISLVVATSITWAHRKPRTSSVNFDFRRATTLSTFSLGIFYLLFCAYESLWVMHGWWSHDVVALSMQLDLIARAFAWFLIGGYLRMRFFPSDEKVFPTFLKVWWCFYLFMDTCFLAMDITFYAKYGIVEIHLLVLDSGSFLVGVFLVYVGFTGKRTQAFEVGEDGDSSVLQPLLNSDCNNDDPSSSFAAAGILSTLTFSWLNPLFLLGYRKTVDLEDVPHLAQSDSIRRVYPSFKCKLESCVPEGSHSNSNGGMNTGSLVRALIYIARWHVVFTGFCALFHTLALYVGPYLINNLVQYLNGTQHFKEEGYVLIFAFVAAKVVECLTQRHWFFRLQQIGIRVQAALVVLIYEKALTVSSSSRRGKTNGEMINLMTVDAERVGGFLWYIHDLWMIPLQVLLALLILYVNLGLASVAALLTTFLVMLANYPIGKLEEKYQEKMMEAKDARMKATSEILRNMRILKLQAWEIKFLSKIMDLRDKETSWLKKYVYTSAVASFAFWGAPTFVSVVSFGACMLLGIPLESGKVLSALATFRVLQMPIYGLPDTISVVIQTKVSLDRICAFLRLEDLCPDSVERLPSGSLDVAIDVTNASFSWHPCFEDATLKNLNFQVLHGKKVAVCGTVGSGKSSLLSCILGELVKLSGNVRLCGRVAYVPQSSWIQSGKVVENILFGKEMDKEKYGKILEACSLKKDIEVLPFGDQTVVGERGINLSGGQKQRIQMARALYEDADVYLLDDPFSALDAHTRTHIFKECVLGFLASKTVVYVTHQVEFLPPSDLILMMQQGRISQIGSYDDMIRSGSDFLKLVDAQQKALSCFRNIESKGCDFAETSNDDNAASDIKVEQEKTMNGEKSNQSEPVSYQKQLVEEEEREKGSVGFSLYWQYITASQHGVLAVPIVLAQILFQVLQIGSNYWMAWAVPASTEFTPPVSSSTLICVYVALSFGSSICVLIRAVLIVTVGYNIAVTLFKNMHICIFRAPMSFFDSTPTGRIINRASTDQDELDTSFFYQMASCLVSIIQLLGIVAVMSQVAWEVFIIFIPVFGACIWYQNHYISTARELSRLIGVHKAPIIQHFAETLAGSSTIRGFNQEHRFLNTNFRLNDVYSRPKFYNAAAVEWLGLRLDMLSSMTFAFSLIFLISLPEGAISPGFAGLVISYGLNLNMLQAWFVWVICNLENDAISVERILQYTRIPCEPPLTIESHKPDLHWPLQGQVDICNLRVRYAPHMPFVLRGVTCTFPGGMKTGIVGRTGSGKSTLIQALFRIVDPTEGQILIDGLNITSIGLHDLRSRLSIIPQDPTMFEGTVRTNLDPLEEYDDAHIWEALDKCQLGDEVRRKEGKLDSTVIENGENWSMGQRQLVCLGRVLLKRSKILVLDEATASVDTASDNLIQKTIREHFSDSTVIAIAHRITSILDSDVVCVVDNGMIAEFNSPANLLADKSSLFSKLVSEYTSQSSAREH